MLRNVLNIYEVAGLQKVKLALTALRAASLALWPATTWDCLGCAPFTTHFSKISILGRANCAASIFIKTDIRFCHFVYLEIEGNAVMQRLEEEDYLRDLPFEPFCDQLAVFYADINMLHPFREGNGCAQRIFFEQLIIHAGYDIHWHPLDRQDWLRANEAGAFGDLAPLAALLKRAVSEPDDDM